MIELKSIEALNKLGLLYYEEGNKENAIEYFEIAGKLGNVNALKNLGSLYKQEGDFDKAIEYYERAGGLGNLDALYYLYSIGNNNNYYGLGVIYNIISIDQFIEVLNSRDDEYDKMFYKVRNFRRYIKKYYFN